MDVGIHYYGWSEGRALQYWKEHIAGEDDIAEREITRVTNWPGQALSYKVGASQIEAFKQQLHISSATIRDFHRVFLNFSCEPLEVIQLNIEEAYRLVMNGGGGNGR